MIYRIFEIITEVTVASEINVNNRQMKTKQIAVCGETIHENTNNMFYTFR